LTTRISQRNWTKFAYWILAFVAALTFCWAQKSETYIGRYLTDFPGPQIYKDQATGTLFYVETDGRHVAAISCAGKVLWSRDPFSDAHLSFYRTKTPQIVYIGPTPEKSKPGEFVAIAFNSSQFGVMRISDGTFLFRGQD
jgi:hypothetical protein